MQIERSEPPRVIGFLETCDESFPPSHWPRNANCRHDARQVVGVSLEQAERNSSADFLYILPLSFPSMLRTTTLDLEPAKEG